MCMHRSDTRVIQTCRNAMWLYYLPICSLHYEAFAAMQHTGFAQLGGSCTHAAANAMTCCFYGYYLYAVFIQKVVESTCSITTAANASYHMRRQLAAGFLL